MKSLVLGEHIFKSIKEAELDDSTIVRLFSPENLKMFVSWLDGIRKVEIGPIEFIRPLSEENIAYDSWYSGLKVFDESKIHLISINDFPEEYRTSPIRILIGKVPEDVPCLAYGWYHAHFFCLYQYLINSWNKEFRYIATGTYFKNQDILTCMVYNGENWIPKEISLNDPMGPKDRMIFQAI